MNTRIKMALAGLITVLLTLFTAQAVILHPAHGDLTRENIEQASRDLGAQFPCVGSGVGVQGEAFHFIGSVVALTDEIAISAMHGVDILEGPRLGEPYDAYHVVFGENSKVEVGAKRFHNVIEVHRHPTQDLVVYEFAEGELANVPKATLYDGKFAPQLNDILIHVGMGYYAHVGDEESVWDGYRRACTALVTGPHGAFPAHYVLTHFRSLPGSRRPSDGGRGTDGDSGGGTFVELENGSFALVAINEMASLGIGDGFTGVLRLSDSDVQEFLVPFLEGDASLPDNGDADRDGHTNLEEYAYGSDPLDVASMPELVYRVEDGQLVLNYLQLEEGFGSGYTYVADDICYVGECSEDLTSWHPAELCDSSYGLPESPDGCQWGAFRMPMSAKAGYIRIKVVREEHSSP